MDHHDNQKTTIRFVAVFTIDKQLEAESLADRISSFEEQTLKEDAIKEYLRR